MKWIEELQEVEADEIVMVEDAPMMIFKGDWICKGRWLDQVVRAKYWYTVGATVATIRMKNVLHADLLMSPISDSNKFPMVHQSVRNHVLPLKPHKLLPQDHDYMMDEIIQSELLNANKEMDDESIDDSNEEDLLSSNDDSDVDKE